MKKAKFLIFVIIAMLIIIFPLKINATDYQVNPEDPSWAGEVTTRELGDLSSITSDILATIRAIGIISSVVILSIIGIKYMLGSLEEKADYKENMKIYIIGCLLLTMATTIPSIIYDIMN